MSPELELQGLIVPRLKADATLASIIGDRVYDHVPRSPTGEVTAGFPFVAISRWQEIPDDADCIDGAVIDITIDAWSRAVGIVEVHRISAAVKKSLDDADVSLSENALVSIEHIGTRTMPDPDGLTSHAVIEFRATVETP